MQVMTVALSLFTPCLRHCMFCSIFTLLGALQVPTSFLIVLLSKAMTIMRHVFHRELTKSSFLCQSFAAVLFTLGLLAYPAGWGSKEVVHATINLCLFLYTQVMKLCHSQPFSPGECRTGAAFWVAVTGTVTWHVIFAYWVWVVIFLLIFANNLKVASYLASCLSIPAHRATQGGKARLTNMV